MHIYVRVELTPSITSNEINVHTTERCGLVLRTFARSSLSIRVRVFIPTEGCPVLIEKKIDPVGLAIGGETKWMVRRKIVKGSCHSSVTPCFLGILPTYERRREVDHLIPYLTSKKINK